MPALQKKYPADHGTRNLTSDEYTEMLREDDRREERNRRIERGEEEGKTRDKRKQRKGVRLGKCKHVWCRVHLQSSSDSDEAPDVLPPLCNLILHQEQAPVVSLTDHHVFLLSSMTDGDDRVVCHCTCTRKHCW